MPLKLKTTGIVVLLVLAVAARSGVTYADGINQAEHRLDRANLLAQRHRAAAQAAARAAAAAKRKQAGLVAKEIAANAALRDNEDRSAALIGRIGVLQAKATAAKAELAADAAAVAPLLPLITRLALHPAATLLAAGIAPGHAAEGALVMQGITSEIGNRARALRSARRRYAALSSDLAAQQADLVQALATQQASNRALQANIVAVQRVASASSARHAREARAAAQAAAQAHDLVGLIDGLRRKRHEEDQARAQAAAARLPAPSVPKSLKGAPVAGSLVRSFAAATSAGPATGDTFEATPGAVVSAPCGGRVAFAKPFGSYGKLMILDCGGGYDFVMSGFDRFDATVGQHVSTGQPVGAMARVDAHNPGNQPRLYVELRHDGTAIDPAGHFGLASVRR